MTLRNLSFALLFCTAFFAAGCGDTATPTNTATNTANRNAANAPATNTNNPVGVTTPTPSQITNNAPTLSPVYKAYCAAVVKKDDAAVRKFFDSETLKHYDEQMKDEGIKKLSEYVDPVTNEVCEVSNEQFKGDKAVAKVKTKSYPNGYEVLWIKENGEWKMSNISPEKGF